MQKVVKKVVKKFTWPLSAAVDFLASFPGSALVLLIALQLIAQCAISKIIALLLANQN